ncbi:MAG TPA: ABC transporter permease [Methanomassiliicoccales archaeon]|nr:ABC transporter permease [Methanomassiliicoccales archaeon]
MSEKDVGDQGRVRELLNKPLFKNAIATIVSLTMFILTWWLVAIWADLVYIPTPGEAFSALVDSFLHEDSNLHITMWWNIYASLKRFVLGFALALGLAIPLGLVMGYSKTFEMLAKPVVEVFRPIPPIAWVPLFILIFAYFWGPVMVIFMGVLFPLLSNIYFGVKSVPPILMDAARTLGATRLHIFTKVVFPYIIPFLMTGIRIGMGIGWMCIVAAEMIGVEGGGLGYYISMQALTLGVYDRMFAGMIVVAVLGLLTTGLMQYLENVTNRRMGIQ